MNLLVFLCAVLTVVAMVSANNPRCINTNANNNKNDAPQRGNTYYEIHDMAARAAANARAVANARRAAQPARANNNGFPKPFYPRSY